MFPHVSELRGESGINRVVEAYHKYLPDFGIEMAEPDADSYDLTAAHAGITGGEVTVCHCHGLYWSNDLNSAEWEYRVNARVIEAIRHAKEWTVPSSWVNESFLRDLRKSAHVIPHGIDWQEWQHKEESQGYVLWNKNRGYSDAVDNSVLNVLVERFPNVPFVSTFPTAELAQRMNSPLWPKNFKILPHGGKTPHKDMKGIVQTAGVYLSTTKETWGIGIAEAMASGVPVLGYAWGGNVDLIQHGVNGFLAKPNDIDSLCEGLDYCIKHRKVLGANGRELAKSWTWAKSCSMVADVYRLAMKQDDRPMVIDSAVYSV